MRMCSKVSELELEAEVEAEVEVDGTGGRNQARVATAFVCFLPTGSDSAGGRAPSVALRVVAAHSSPSPVGTMHPLALAPFDVTRPDACTISRHPRCP